MSDDPLAGVSLELQAKALALTLEAAFPGQVQVSYINVLTDPRGPGLPQTALLNSNPTPPPWCTSTARGASPGPWSRSASGMRWKKSWQRAEPPSPGQSFMRFGARRSLAATGHD